MTDDLNRATGHRDRHMHQADVNVDPASLAEARRHVQEACTCLDEGRLGGAAQACERALRLVPNWAEAHHLQGQVLEQMGFVHKAGVAYEQAAHPDAVSYDVWAAQELGTDDVAWTEEESTHAEPVAGAQKLLEQARRAREAGKFGSALRKCEAALQLAPDWPDAHILRQTILEDVGYDEQANVADPGSAPLDTSADDDGLDPVRADVEFVDDDLAEFVVLRTFAFPSHAYIARGRLEAEGIPSFVAQDEIVNMNWLYLYMVRWVKLYVHQQDAERALAILDCDWADEAESEPCCPQCGSADVRYEKYNLRRVYAAILLLSIPIPFRKERWICRKCGATWKEESI